MGLMSPFVPYHDSAGQTDQKVRERQAMKSLRSILYHRGWRGQETDQ